MNEKLTKQQTDEILQALDKAITAGPWEESNFLRVIGKNLREIRDNFANELKGSNKEKMESNLKNKASMQPGQREIYISLYSSEGSNLQAWERILANLPRQIISRPIYTEEEAVQQLIKAKENKINEAYVAIYVEEKDILNVAEDKIPRDKFGKPLMSLKDRAINLDKINRFVHLSIIYHYNKGRLVPA